MCRDAGFQTRLNITIAKPIATMTNDGAAVIAIGVGWSVNNIHVPYVQVLV